MLSNASSKLMHLGCYRQLYMRNSMLLMRIAMFSQRSTLTSPKTEEIKFSSFLKSEKSYSVPAPKG